MSLLPSEDPWTCCSKRTLPMILQGHRRGHQSLEANTIRDCQLSSPTPSCLCENKAQRGYVVPVLGRRDGL